MTTQEREKITEEFIDEVAQTFIDRLNYIADLAVYVVPPARLRCVSLGCERYASVKAWLHYFPDDKTTELEVQERDLCHQHTDTYRLKWQRGELYVGKREVIKFGSQPTTSYTTR